MSQVGSRRRALRFAFVLALLLSPLLVLGALELICRRVEEPGAPAPVRVTTANVHGDAPWVAEHRANVDAYYARYSPGPVIRYAPYTGWVMREFASSTLNVEDDGVRRTKSSEEASPTTDVFRIYMVGGSTMVCADVPDDLTLPSQMANELGLLRGPGTKKLDVVNLGASAYSSTQELLRVLHEMQRGFARRGRPDVVVFYDGVNDVWAGVHLGHPGYPDALDRMRQRFDDLPGFLRLKAREVLEARSALARRLLRGGPSAASAPLDRGKVRSLSEQQASIYAQNMKVTSAWGRDFGFTVLHVLQPVIFVLERGHADDASLRDALAASDPGLAAANVEGYRAFRALFAATPGTLDLSAGLEGADAPLYIDYCHLGAEGNRRIAQRLAAAIHARP